jgi:hypothetical protein
VEARAAIDAAVTVLQAALGITSETADR